jgi:ElaB/YqjD/DUF883 family membrane-anchored ribosome-binding protein
MKHKEISDIRKKTHDGVDKIMDKAESIQKSGEKEIANLKEKATMVKEKVDGYVKENPKKAVLIAAATGAVVGAAVVAVLKKKQ